MFKALYTSQFWEISKKLVRQLAHLSTGVAHIRELNNKVLGKSAIKKGRHFSRGRPFKIVKNLC